MTPTTLVTEADTTAEWLGGGMPAVVSGFILGGAVVVVCLVLMLRMVKSAASGL